MNVMRNYAKALEEQEADALCQGCMKARHRASELVAEIYFNFGELDMRAKENYYRAVVECRIAEDTCRKICRKVKDRMHRMFEPHVGSMSATSRLRCQDHWIP